MSDLRNKATMTLTGMAPAGVFAIIAVQISGALSGVLIASLLYPSATSA